MSVSGHFDPQSSPSDAAESKAPTVEQLLPDPCQTTSLHAQDDIAAAVPQSPGFYGSATRPIPHIPQPEF
jgi:hypothetical protein